MIIIIIIIILTLKVNFSVRFKYFLNVVVLVE